MSYISTLELWLIEQSMVEDCSDGSKNARIGRGRQRVVWTHSILITCLDMLIDITDAHQSFLDTTVQNNHPPSMYDLAGLNHGLLLEAKTIDINYRRKTAGQFTSKELVAIAQATWITMHYSIARTFAEEIRQWLPHAIRYRDSLFHVVDCWAKSGTIRETTLKVDFDDEDYAIELQRLHIHHDEQLMILHLFCNQLRSMLELSQTLWDELLAPSIHTSKDRVFRDALEQLRQQCRFYALSFVTERRRDAEKVLILLAQIHIPTHLTRDAEELSWYGHYPPFKSINRDIAELMTPVDDDKTISDSILEAQEGKPKSNLEVEVTELVEEEVVAEQPASTRCTPTQTKVEPFAMSIPDTPPQTRDQPLTEAIPYTPSQTRRRMLESPMIKIKSTNVPIVYASPYNASSIKQDTPVSIKSEPPSWLD